MLFINSAHMGNYDEAIATTHRRTSSPRGAMDDEGRLRAQRRSRAD